jgi:hypothetical protein
MQNKRQTIQKQSSFFNWHAVTVICRKCIQFYEISFFYECPFLAVRVFYFRIDYAISQSALDNSNDILRGQVSTTQINIYRPRFLFILL